MDERARKMLDTEEKKSWKEQAAELRKQAESVLRKSDVLEEKKKAYLSKSDSGDDNENPAPSENLTLVDLSQLKKIERQLMSQRLTLLNWLSEFEWASKKMFWIGLFAALIVAILAGHLF